MIFLKCFTLADFDFEDDEPEVTTPESSTNSQTVDAPKLREVATSTTGQVGFNVSYTINLNLPETTNPDVFNAIFKSLKENLLEN